MLLAVSKSDNECLNGKDPANLTNKEALLEFSKGPCSPFILLHGIVSSKLVVEIDCPVLKAEHPEIFKICGWTDCHKRPIEFWKFVPDREYHVWIPGFTSPMNIFTFSEDTNFCWAKFVKQAVDFTKPIDQAIQPTKGFKMKVFGSTEGTKNKHKCGDAAIIDLFDSYIQPSSSRAFKRMLESVKKMGYIPGLTYQSIPYNFNMPLGNNELSPAFSDNIRRLNEITGKKVSIISHSFGGVNTLYQLNRMSTEYKKSAIKVWINIAAPFLGSTKGYRTIISGNEQFSFLDHKFGLHLKASLEASSSSVGTFLLLSPDPFTLYKDQKWFRSIEKRMQYEQGLIPFESTDLQFLPKIESVCSPGSFYPLDPRCLFGIYDTSADYMVKIADDEYKLTELREMVTKWNITANAVELADITKDALPLELKNPEVPILSINLRSLPTARRYTYGPDLRKFVEEDKYYIPEIVNGMGDGSVPAFSQFIPLFKWAKEFDDKVEGAQPVKFADFCSLYDQKYNPYDGFNDYGEKEFVSNEFFGISCDCIANKTADNCEHSVMIEDSKLFRLVANTLQANETSYSTSYEFYVQELEDEYLKTITTTCPQIIYK